MTEQRARRRWWPTISTLVVSALVVATLAILFVIPGPFIHTEAVAKSGVVTARIDGREVAVTVYLDNGANPFWRMLKRDGSGGMRITAVDLETGEPVWDEEIHDPYRRERQLIGATDQYVFLRTTFHVYVFSLADGSVVATEDDIEGLDGATRSQGRIVHREGSDTLLFTDGDSDGFFVLDMNTLKVSEPDADTVATWQCVLDRMRTPYDTPTHVATASSPGLRSATDDAGYLARAVYVAPVTGRCGQMTADDEVIGEDDIFPTGQTAYETLGEGTTNHRLQRDDDTVTVVDTEDGAEIDTSSPVLEVVSGAASPEGRFAFIRQRDLSDIAPAVRGQSSSVLYTVGQDGTIHEVILGRHGWFGRPW